jgi:hypothetical protein
MVKLNIIRLGSLGKTSNGIVLGIFNNTVSITEVI